IVRALVETINVLIELPTRPLGNTGLAVGLSSIAPRLCMSACDVAPGPTRLAGASQSTGGSRDLIPKGGRLLAITGLPYNNPGLSRETPFHPNGVARFSSAHSG